MPALAPIPTVRGTAVPYMGDDVDTDRIIPARYMKCVTFDDLGEFAFYDERKEEDGTDREHVLNDPRYAGATLLLAGANFGCGSSREHAPQSLYRFGYRGVIAESFAEIFFGNSITLGMPCFAMERPQLEELAALVREDPAVELELDVAREEVRAGERVFPAHLPESARKSLLEGRWDPIAELLEHNAEVDAVADRLSYI